MGIEGIDLRASICSLIEAAKTVIDYMKDVYEATEEKKRLLEEVLATRDILTKLDCHSNEEKWKKTMEALSRRQGPLEQLNGVLKRMDAKLRPPKGKWSTAAKALIWPFAKGEVSLFLSRIERIKTLLNLALQNEHLFSIIMSTVSNRRAVTEAIKASIESLVDMLKGKPVLPGPAALIVDQRSKSQDEEHARIIKWLSDLNFWAKQDDTFQRHQEGTCKWFLNDPTFQNWVEGPESSVLWCPGDRIVRSTFYSDTWQPV